MSATLAVQTSGFPATSWPRRIARASGMLCLCSAGSIATTYAHFFLMVAFGSFPARSVWTPWDEAWLGGLFWPAAIVGALWAWGWALFRLWNCRWIRAGILITLGSLALTLLFPVLGILMFSLQFLWIAFAAIHCGTWKRLARR